MRTATTSRTTTGAAMATRTSTTLTTSRPPVRARPRSSVTPETSTHGALAIDRQPEPIARLRTVPEQARPPVRDPLSRITTLHPTNYAEARAIGEHYREGIPVIMNLTEMENADAKRLVDFAAGLA